MMKRSIQLAIFISAIFWATAALAHHSMAGTYDMARSTAIRGVLTEIGWRNPHAFVVMNARDPNGKIVNWRIEIAAPNALSRLGLTPQMLDLTSTYSVEIWPARDGSFNASGRSLTFPDGRQFDIHDVWGPAGLSN